ncbi:MAG: hypothetical protein ACYTGV_05195 [Planctomycetota bacterium]|jgi:hypothetical protein
MTKRVAVAVVLLAVAGLAWADATKTWVESEIVGAQVIYMGNGFVDDAGILHVKGQQLAELMEGDLEGTLYVEANFNVDLLTWTGDMHGKLRFDGTWDDLEGEFEGKFSGTWTNGYFDGHWVMKGTEGDFVGLHLKVDNYGPGSGPQTVEGIVLDPGN